MIYCYFCIVCANEIRIGSSLLADISVNFRAKLDETELYAVLSSTQSSCRS
ncbi:hypothetical protein T11_6475 [Trichinella zimbabwensis]|uniref:Uncharacterized protein n=1 Tax=Trichinella zimbabwensis TaxID=268475 RepID=A0A0V1GHQ2_9BILA|nr:hypothetical protein T11_6475 [Trichinella zimbabwensis]